VACQATESVGAAPTEPLLGLLTAGERLRPEGEPRELSADHLQLVLRAGFVSSVSALSVGEVAYGPLLLDGGSKADQSLIDKSIPTRRMLIKLPIFQQRRPKADIDGAEILQCSVSWRTVVCYRLGWQHSLVGSASPRFRTIQVWPKDLPTALRQAERGKPTDGGARPLEDSMFGMGRAS